jgi:hypothetical protein
MILGALIAAAPAREIAAATWPPYTPNPAWAPRWAPGYYRDTGVTYGIYLGDYSAAGDCLNYGKWYASHYARWNKDPLGVPLLSYNGELCYSPVTEAQYGLWLYGRLLAGEETRDLFLHTVHHLMSLQDDQGAFRLYFRWDHQIPGGVFEPGWVSALAQGQALSLLSRAYRVNPNPRYLEAGNKALSFLLRRIENGGVMTSLAGLDPSLTSCVWFEEYPANPPPYTLNGFMFVLIGLYDWSEVSAVEANIWSARLAFDAGNRTLVKALKYFDLGGFTSYDLRQLVYHLKPLVASPGYHALHIGQLYALHSITGLPEYKEYADLWASYVRQPTTLTLTAPPTAPPNGEVALSAVLSVNTKRISGQEIAFYWEGKPLGTALTDGLGKAVLEVTPLSDAWPVGTNTITAAFSGFAEYLPSDTSTDIEVRSPNGGALVHDLALQKTPDGKVELQWSSGNGKVARVYRAQAVQGPYAVIAENITGGRFLDATPPGRKQAFYFILEN